MNLKPLKISKVFYTTCFFIFSIHTFSQTQLGSDIDGEAANDQSGYSVSLSSDGTIVAIGARDNDGNGLNAGHTRIYQYSSGSWSQLGSDIDGEAAIDYAGYSVSLSSDGTKVAIGAPLNDGTGSDAGLTRIYQYNDSSWSQLGSDIGGEAAGDNAGWSVSLSSDGTKVAIGAHHNDGTAISAGHTRIYSLQTNSTPTNITLNPTTVNENVSLGATVGSLSTTDSDSGDSHTYSLVAGSGDTDNASFSISGANLLTGTALDYETKNSYSIRVQTSDGTATYAKTFTITVADVFEDADGDGIPDQTDNCQSSANPNQADADADGIGDVCDSDIDGDGFANSSDNCPSTVNVDQADFDADGSGDLCDLDDDNDGVLDTDDAFPLDETETVDTDNDGIGNNADQDDDNDTYLDSNDDFPLDSSEWIDTDGDGLGNNEDLNDDDDYCLDEDDDFPLDSSLCIDTDGDGIDNSFDIDIDGDGVWNDQDDFPLDASESKDTDGDGIGDNTDPDINNDGFPEGQLFISGALTPQSGGLESTWKIINLEMYSYSVVKVFSPDGSLVFKDILYQNDWKGTHYKTGKALPTGPYLYQIYIGEKEEPLTGWIYIFN